ncbi:MAG: acyltransferase [Bacteroidales bacterium]|nr:acyltransferase [Bacteroidales bacterium]
MDFLHITTKEDFNRLTLDTFKFQAANNPVYRQYLNLLGITPAQKILPEEIPFLPIEFFKTNRIICGNEPGDLEFTSSGTTGSSHSTHIVLHREWYHQSLLNGFIRVFGDPADYCLLALLPSYLERTGSSLVYMMDQLIRHSGHPLNGFYLNNLEELARTLHQLETTGQKTLLTGVPYALLDFAEQFAMKLNYVQIMETGGMKGKRKEMLREELHQMLQKAFGTGKILSEYGMTELLSQAYSTGDGRFFTPPWMQIRIRDPYNPFQTLPDGKVGGIDIIDLANRYSCAFIQTQDLGRSHPDGSFEVLGRFENSDLRGCNLLVSE